MPDHPAAALRELTKLIPDVPICFVLGVVFFKQECGQSGGVFGGEVGISWLAINRALHNRTT